MKSALETVLLKTLRSSFRKMVSTTIKNTPKTEDIKMPNNIIVQKLNKIRAFANLMNEKVKRNLLEGFYHIILKDSKNKRLIVPIIKLTESVKRIKLTLLCLAFFQIQLISQKRHYEQMKRRSKLHHLLTKKALQEHFSLQKFFSAWRKDAILGSAVSEQQTRLKEYRLSSVARILNKVLLLNKFEALGKMKAALRDNKKGPIFARIIIRLIHKRLELAINKIKFLRIEEEQAEKMKSKLQRLIDVIQHRRSRQKLEFMTKAKILYNFSSVLDNNRKVSNIVSILQKILTKRIEHGFKMLELNHISKGNKKQLYINLVLKVLVLFINKHRSYKEKFMRRLLARTAKSYEKKRVLEKLIIRKYFRTLFYYFLKFKNGCTTAKVNNSMVSVAIKSLKLAIDKLDRLQRDAKSHAFRKLIVHSNIIRVSPVITTLTKLDLPDDCMSPMSLFSPSQSNAQLKKFVTFFTKVEPVFLQRKAYVLR